MKRHILLTLTTLFTSSLLSAQDPTPNSGFENWTLVNGVNQYYTPDGWDQLNAATDLLGTLTCVQTTDAHSGSFAVKLITKVVTSPFGTDTANGIITTGRLILVPPYGVNGGIPYHDTPDSIYGWYKYTPTPGDSLQIEFDVFDVNNVIIGTALFKSSQTVSSYTRFSAPVVYFSSGIPDTSRWIISSSNGYNSLPNSTLYIDDVGIAYHTAVESIPLDDFITLSPNPASGILWVKNDKLLNGSLHFYNSLGADVKQVAIDNNTNAIAVDDLPQGLYLLQLFDTGHQALATQKLLLQN